MRLIVVAEAHGAVDAEVPDTLVEAAEAKLPLKRAMVTTPVVRSLQKVRMVATSV